jgi:DNA repair protein RecO (recombination protein O)
MLNKTSGIILQSTKYSETSLIVKIYTRDFGLGSYIVSGVRSKRSKNKASLFQSLALVDIVMAGNQRQAMSRISEISIHQPYYHLPFDIIKSSIAIFINEVLLHSFKEPHPDEELFLFLKSSLLILDLDTGGCSNFHLGFLLQFCRFLGFSPQGEYSGDTPIFDLQEGKFVNYLPKHSFYLNSHASGLLYRFAGSSYAELNDVKLSKEERKQLLNALVLFYQLHIPSFGTIKSIPVLEEIIG